MTFSRITRLGAGSAVLAGLVYSLLVLTTSHVYAASCDCTQDQFDASQYCFSNYNSPGLTFFRCPAPDSSHYEFACAGDPLHHSRVFACP
jgi:hypothetical protein